MFNENMSSKKIIIITGIIIFLILLFFVFYLMFIKPVIIGEYTPSEAECEKGYDCVCLKDTCNCFYKKWFWENKLACKRSNIKESQMEKR